jgi:hypothetical protein
MGARSDANGCVKYFPPADKLRRVYETLHFLPSHRAIRIFTLSPSPLAERRAWKRTHDHGREETKQFTPL